MNPMDQPADGQPAAAAPGAPANVPTPGADMGAQAPVEPSAAPMPDASVPPVAPTEPTAPAAEGEEGGVPPVGGAGPVPQ